MQAKVMLKIALQVQTACCDLMLAGCGHLAMASMPAAV